VPIKTTGHLKPYIVSPKDGETNVSIKPLVIASDFTSADNVLPYAVEWQLAEDPAFTINKFTDGFSDHTGDPINTLKSKVISKLLQHNKTYYIRMRYLGADGQYTEWSDPVSFTTVDQAPWILFTTLNEEHSFTSMCSRTDPTGDYVYATGRQLTAVNRPGYFNAFITKIRKNSGIHWTKAIKGEFYTYYNDIFDFEENGNVYLYAVGVKVVDYVNGESYGVVTKWTSDGSLVWSKKITFSDAALAKVNLVKVSMIKEGSEDILRIAGDVENIDNNTAKIFVLDLYSDGTVKRIKIRSVDTGSRVYGMLTFMHSNTQYTVLLGTESVSGVKHGFVMLWNDFDVQWVKRSSVHVDEYYQAAIRVDSFQPYIYCVGKTYKYSDKGHAVINKLDMSGSILESKVIQPEGAVNLTSITTFEGQAYTPIAVSGQVINDNDVKGAFILGVDKNLDFLWSRQFKYTGDSIFNDIETYLNYFYVSGQFGSNGSLVKIRSDDNLPITTIPTVAGLKLDKTTQRLTLGVINMEYESIFSYSFDDGLVTITDDNYQDEWLSLTSQLGFY
jgi:hypothetical protein